MHLIGDAYYVQASRCTLNIKASSIFSITKKAVNHLACIIHIQGSSARLHFMHHQ